jgi:hypothetical protein
MNRLHANLPWAARGAWMRRSIEHHAPPAWGEISRRGRSEA